ncbi:MinD/ParA family ATP-binding protein [Halospeciosus flavus]|uniref:MinD/ParA family protein n=1 Tax=Halospeciosus flavus TaxID=3032283 RepID=A0ABD5Z7R5_9EURY|nr:chromosome partitioning protein ParA [Halospeciosus flavus]
MILAVAGGKGGVGKSTVALNLGAELDAVVVDGDLSMADLPAGRGPDLHDVLAGRADPVEAVREGAAGGSVSLLPCGRSLAGARAADPLRLAATVETVEREYGAVVVDCPAGLRVDAGVPLAASDACVLVTRPTAPALTDAVRTRALARTLDAGVAAVVLSRARPSEEERTAVDRLLGGPTVAVPADETVDAARRGGVPVREVDPDAAAAVALGEVAATVRRSLCSAV